MKFRIRYMTAEGVPHVYLRVFVANSGGTFALCGNLTMRREEFEALRMMFRDAEYVVEDTKP